MIFNLIKHAKQLLFDNSKSKLSATNTQDAIDELNSKVNTLEDEVEETVKNNFTANRALVSNGNGDVAVSAVTTTELGYLDGVTGAIQTQLNNKATSTSVSTLQNTVNGKVTNSFTASRALVSDANGKVAVSAVTSAELGCLDGVTSAIQTQLDNKVTNNFTNKNAVLFSDANGKVSASNNVTITEVNFLDGVTSNIQTQINDIDTKATTANNNATKALKCLKASSAQNDIPQTIGTASTYLFDNATGTSADETVMTSVASGVYIKESGNYDISIAISVSLQQEDVLNVGYRNFGSASDYTDVTRKEYAKGYHHVGYHEIGTWLNAGRYVRPIISGSKGGDIGACSLTVIKR